MAKRSLASVDSRQIEKFKPLALSAAKHFAVGHNRYLFDDIYSAALVAIAEAIAQFDDTRGTTLAKHIGAEVFFAACDEFKALTRFRVRSKANKPGSIYDPVAGLNDGTLIADTVTCAKCREPDSNAIVAEEMERIFAGESDRDKTILTMKLDGFTNVEIAKVIGCDPSNINYTMKNICKSIGRKTGQFNVAKRVTKIFGNRGMRIK